MSKRKRLVLGVGSAVFLAIIFGFVVRVVARPPMPSEWQTLRAGMSRDELLAKAPGEHVDMRELKGFDVFTRETSMLGGSSYWQLDVTYDQSGRLARAEASFIHRSCGLLSRAVPKSVL